MLADMPGARPVGDPAAVEGLARVIRREAEHVHAVDIANVGSWRGFGASVAGGRVSAAGSRLGTVAARESVHNAWRDTVERLLEAGLPVTPALTTAEIVALTRRRVRAAAPSSLGDLAGVVDRACYAPEEPEPATPSHAWALNTRIRKEVRRGLSIPHRLRAFLDPRPLRFARR